MKIFTQLLIFDSVMDMCGISYYRLEREKPIFDIFFEHPDIDIIMIYGDEWPALHKCLQKQPDTHLLTNIEYQYIYDNSLEIPYIIDIMSSVPLRIDENLKCDIGINGLPDKKIYPLGYPIGKYNLKIIGPKTWPMPQYIGNINLEDKRNFYTSAKVIVATNIIQALLATSFKRPCICLDPEIKNILPNITVASTNEELIDNVDSQNYHFSSEDYNILVNQYSSLSAFKTILEQPNSPTEYLQYIDIIDKKIKGLLL